MKYLFYLKLMYAVSILTKVDLLNYLIIFIIPVCNILNKLSLLLRLFIQITAVKRNLGRSLLTDFGIGIQMYFQYCHCQGRKGLLVLPHRTVWEIQLSCLNTRRSMYAIIKSFHAFKNKSDLKALSIKVRLLSKYGPFIQHF